MRLVKIGLASLLGVALACSGGTTGTSGDDGSGSNPRVSVGIADFSFTPETVVVRAGTDVLWTNGGPSDHTTTSDASVWDSGVLSTQSGGNYGSGGSGGGFIRTFNQTGEFPYHCSIHPFMQGVVIVTE